MSDKPRLLVFAGSARVDSFNKKLARITAARARAAGADTTYIDLDDFPLPLYHGDIEAASGFPPAAQALRHLFRTHHAFAIASPEYNHSFSALLKNVIDWVSRPAGGEDYKPFFSGKVALLLATSPGSSGGSRGLPHLRQVLSHLGVDVLEPQITVPKHFQSFDADGALVEPARDAEIAAAVTLLVQRLGERVHAVAD